MRCGNCKESHDTVAEVRECYGLEDQGSGLTEVQQGYLRDLLNHFNLVLPDGATTETIDRPRGKLILDGLIGARRLQAMGKEYTLPDGVLISPKPDKKRSERRPTKRDKSGSTK